MAPMKAKTITFSRVSSQLRLARLAFVQSIPYNSQQLCCWAGATLHAAGLGNGLITVGRASRCSKPADRAVQIKAQA